MWLTRPGARYAGPACSKRATASSRRKCRTKAPDSFAATRRISSGPIAKYFEPAGPVSWDVAMTGYARRLARGAQEGRHARDQHDLRDQARRPGTSRWGSWWPTWPRATTGKNPFKSKVNHKGKVTHGHLKENRVHGGKKTELPDPRKLASGAVRRRPAHASTASPTRPATCACPGVAEAPADASSSGQSLTFELGNGDNSTGDLALAHLLQAALQPLDRHRLSDPGRQVPVRLGSARRPCAPAVCRRTWETPKNLPEGTYTYFCRIHPFMRGAFRVKQ